MSVQENAGISKNNICRYYFNPKTISKVYGCTKRRICENDSLGKDRLIVRKVTIV